MAGLCAGSALPRAAAAPLPGPTPEQESKILQLVGQLGDPSFRVRQQATQELTKFGRLPKAALLAGLEHADAEVRVRCRRLLPNAMALDRQARLEAFIADKDGKEEHDLAGWKRFRKLVGTDAPARDLFVKIQKANSELLEMAEFDPSLVSERFGPTCNALSTRGVVSLGDVAAMMFLATFDDIRTDAQGYNPVLNFLWQNEYQQAMRTGPEAPVRKLTLAFFERRTDPNSLQNAMSLAVQFGMKEYVPLAGKIAADKGQQVYARSTAMTVVAKLGGKDQMALLEPIFEDKTVFGPWQWNNLRGTTEIRDVALATALKLTGQNFKEYGYDVLGQQPQLIEHSPYLCGFSKDETRDAAFKKWKEWKEKQADAKDKPAEKPETKPEPKPTDPKEAPPVPVRPRPPIRVLPVPAVPVPALPAVPLPPID
jgi:hypothetical protein